MVGPLLVTSAKTLLLHFTGVMPGEVPVALVTLLGPGLYFQKLIQN